MIAILCYLFTFIAAIAKIFGSTDLSWWIVLAPTLFCMFIFISNDMIKK